MKNIIKKIKNFFKKIFGMNDIKLLEQANIKEIEENKEKYETDKKEIFEIYKKIKNGEYNPDNLDDQNRKKINTLIKREIEIKKNHLEEKTTELKALRQENMPNEKQRIIDLYYQVKDKNIDLESIEYDDLIKIRKLLIEEANMRDELIMKDIYSLENLVIAETSANG